MQISLLIKLIAIFICKN